VQYRLLINIILLVVVIGLTLLLINTDKQEPVVENIPLTGIDPANVEMIQIDRKQSDVLRFSKAGIKWRMQAPYQLPANEFRINTMLKLLQAHSYTQFNKDDVDLNRFLLAEPELSIQFNDTRIYFGDTSPLAEQRYVLVDDRVHLINDSLYQQLQAPATFYLSTRLLPEGIEIMSINFPEYSISMETGVWSVSPQSDISADKLVAIINAWQTLDAISISAYEATDKTESIHIDAGTAGRFEFIIAAPSPKLVLARPDIGIQYHISGYDTKRLFIPDNNDISETTEDMAPVTNHNNTGLSAED
jgi:hypothetical protein